MSIVSANSVVNVKDMVRGTEEMQLFSPLGCGFQTGSGTVSNVANAGPDDVICIIGLGGVGLAAIMTAKIQGYRKIIAIDRVQSRLELASELGATMTIDTSKVHGGSLVDLVRRESDDIGPNITIDTTGVPLLIRAGLEWTRNRGKYVQIGSAPFDFKLEMNVFAFMESGKQFIGAIQGQCHPQEYLQRMISWYRRGIFPIDKLVKRYPVEDFEQALKDMGDGITIKPVLSWTV